MVGKLEESWVGRSVRNEFHNQMEQPIFRSETGGIERKKKQQLVNLRERKDEELKTTNEEMEDGGWQN